MSGSPWMGVLFIGGAFGCGLLVILMFAKAGGLHRALNGTLRLPLLIALLIIGFGASALTVRFGIEDVAPFQLWLALSLLGGAAAPREVWARWLLWLDGAVLLVVTAGFWIASRDFPTAPLWFKAAILLLVGGGVLWAVAISFAGLLNSPKTSTAETGTPA